MRVWGERERQTDRQAENYYSILYLISSLPSRPKMAEDTLHYRRLPLLLLYAFFFFGPLDFEKTYLTYFFFILNLKY